ncbi:MAG: aminotransferase DegT [Pelagibacteraceae bacterium TMED237]|nr:aminotransferase DegT [Candidatus Neomarinimicrobiota bacterium]OUW96609.1 MAG: aminotransferase DegT [Pelagibacteraceae bacterium TMED237]|tara:strand:- start:4320 stop:5444 length:1125 start_codon:yes stop_codon:yes gene_type:complete
MQFIDLKKQYKILKKDIDKNINSIFDRCQFIMGPEVIELEQKLSKYTGSKYCLSCSSGTDALLIALMARGVGPGDAIITTPFTYIATAEVISLLGATPIFADIYPNTFNINPDGIIHAFEKAKSKNLKPRGIIPVNLFGLPSRYRLIKKIADELDLFIIEDAAQSFGSSIRKKKSCSYGDIATTSFFPAKPLGCYGDGGAIFTDNKDCFLKMESIRIHGQGKNKYDCDRIGLNGRLDTIQAAVLLAKLSIYDKEIEMRQNVANLYFENLKNQNKIQTPFIPVGYTSVWAQYSVLFESQSVRLSVIQNLQKKGIPSVVYYEKPLHLQKAFMSLEYNYGDFPISEDTSLRILSLPMHPYLESSDIENICNIIKASI